RSFPPQPAPPATATSTDTETASQRNYELGREVAVTSTRPGALTKLSVAVALSAAALKKAAPMTAAQLDALGRAAGGADAARGDMVEVVASKFEPADLEPPAFYEEPWFAMLVRYGTALIAVLLVLLFAVRPLIGKLRGRGEPAAAPATDAEGENVTLLPGTSGGVPLGDLPRQVELARRLAVSQPDRAVEALQRMLAAPDNTPDTTGAEPSAT
ncbi:MAG: flagellar M-ring protein FliF C-terminal domain-containing protein, partial [Erythrobacteraceae bacterium]